MGRLIKRTRRYDNPAVDCGGTYQMFYDPLYPALCKLAHYEDLEEQGRLIEQKYGYWMLEREPDGKPYCFHCSVCDDDFSYIGIRTGYDYCPLCGARMLTKEEAEAKLKELEGDKE